LLFIHDDRNVLTARDAGTGRIRWSVSMGSELARIVGVELVGGRVYSFSTADVQILDVDSGSLVDRQKLEVLVNTEPLNDWPLFVFGTVTGEVLAHDGSIGFKEWGYQLEGRITQPAVDTGSAIGVVSQGGQFVLLDPRTGRRFGRIQEMFDGAGAEPVTDGRTVFIASLDQSLYAVDAADATERWRLRTEYPLTDQPVVHRGVVYQAVPFRGLVAIGAARGDIRWTADDVFGRVVRIDRDADELLVWDGRHLVTVGMERGDERSRREIPGVARLITTDLVGGDLYTEYADGRLSKFILSP
jgi:outer membrane protein assembly factor BamB